ncbi:hypothetical protein [Streptomyces sp. HC307]
MSRRRSIVIDTLGLLPAVLVTAVGVQYPVAGTDRIDHVAAAPPALRKA